MEIGGSAAPTTEISACPLDSDKYTRLIIVKGMEANLFQSSSLVFLSKFL